MKNKMLWIGSVIILILSIICFVVFGVGTELLRVFTGDANKIKFGSYDGKNIVLEPNTEFANAINNFTTLMRSQKSELDESDNFYIYNYAFNSAVQSEAYKKAVKESGYKPSSKIVSNTMLPFFLNQEGKYDPTQANLIPDETKKQLKAEVETMLTWRRFENDLFGGSKDFGDIIACLSDYTRAFYINTKEEVGKSALYGLKTSEKESQFFANIGSEMRAFDAISYDKATYPNSEVTKFGNENSSLFDSYALSVITVTDESQAKKLLSQITNNEVTFEDGVSTYSEKYFSNGYGVVEQNFAYQIKDTLENEADFEKIDSLAKDSLSEVIKNVRGYSIYKCTGGKTKADISDEKTFDAVKSYITINKQSLIDDYFTEKAKAFIANAKLEGFDKAALKAGVEKLSIPAFPLNYGEASVAGKLDAKDAKAFLNASRNESFLEKAFSMKLNDISEPMIMGNYVTVFKLTDIQTEKADESKLETIKTDLAGYDQSSAQTVLFTSPKLKNEVSKTYRERFLPQ